MSEPDAGSDLASLTTSARREGDDFVINGQKIWTSFAALADYCYLICRTDSDAEPHRGISEVIVPMDTPGIDVRPITDMTTNRHFCEVWFTDVRVPVANLVGDRGQRLQADHGATRARARRHRPSRVEPGAVPARPANAPTGPTRRFGSEIAATRDRRTASGGSSSPARCCARPRPGSPRPPSASAPSTKFASPSSSPTILGADAMLWTDVTHGLDYAPGYTIMGGTSNVMRNILGERVLGLPRGPKA